MVMSICLGLIADARAATSVEVLATDPPGAHVQLGRNQNFYLRVGYRTDQPISIWARPYYQGREAKAGTNPSRRYNGAGEALGWFFFMEPGNQVDEIRINVGDGTPGGTYTAMTYPVHIVGNSEPASAHKQPAWVMELTQKEQAAQQADYDKRMNTPPSAGDVVLFNGFMLLMLALGVVGFAAPVWGVWRWREGWRIAAAVPAAMMAFVVMRLVFGVARDPTSHNLWPFEILQVGALSVAIMLALFAARKISGASR